MIETREQFEGLKEWAEIAQKTGNNEAYEYKDCVETIEVLLEVARAAGPAWEIMQGEGRHLVTAFDRLFHALYALSDWMKEE